MAMERIKAEAEDAKKKLSISYYRLNISIPFITANEQGPQAFKYDTYKRLNLMN